jgi:hypothetical protein
LCYEQYVKADSPSLVGAGAGASCATATAGMTMAKTSAAAAMRVLLAMADGEEEKMPRSNLDLCQWIPYLSLLVRICPFLGCLAYKTALSLLSLAHTIIPLQRLSLSPCLLSLKPLDLAGMRRRWAPRTCTTVAGTCFFDRTDSLESHFLRLAAAGSLPASRFSGLECTCNHL